jgi:TRAP-type uncharacterized transport system fused permease subunit
MNRAKLTGAITVYAALIALFHFYINLRGGISDLWFNAAHFSFLASLGFLLYRTSKHSDAERIPWYDIALSLLALVPFFYIMLTEE